MKKNIMVVLLGIMVLVAFTAALSDVPDNMTLQGKKKGPVAFPHKAHVDAGMTCKSCHHTVAGDMDSPEKGCHDCHTETSEVKVMKAFHNNCNTCHKKTNKAEGTKLPTKCNECHAKK